MEFECLCDDWKFCIVPSAFLADNTITDGAKVTFSVLMIWGRTKGMAWPSRVRAAEARGVGVRTLQRHITDLHNSGWLTRRLVGERVVLHLHNHDTGPVPRVAEGESDGGCDVPTVAGGGESSGTLIRHLEEEEDEPKVGGVDLSLFDSQDPPKPSGKTKTTSAGRDEFEQGWRESLSGGTPRAGPKDNGKPTSAWSQWGRLLKVSDWSPAEALNRWRAFMRFRPAEHWPQTARLLNPDNENLTDDTLRAMEKGIEIKAKADASNPYTPAPEPEPTPPTPKEIARRAEYARRAALTNEERAAEDVIQRKAHREKCERILAQQRADKAAKAEAER